MARLIDNHCPGWARRLAARWAVRGARAAARIDPPGSWKYGGNLHGSKKNIHREKRAAQSERLVRFYSVGFHYPILRFV